MNSSKSSELFIVFRIIIRRNVTNAYLKRIFVDYILFICCIILYSWIISLISFCVESAIPFPIINLSILSRLIPISLLFLFISMDVDKKVRYFNFSEWILNIISNFCLISSERPIIKCYPIIAKVFTLLLLLLLLHFTIFHETLIHFSICHERFWGWNWR